MPAEALHERLRQRVERPDEHAVVDGALPSAVQPRPHRKPFRHDADLAKPGHERLELADAELQQHRRIVVLEADLHDLGERVQPRHAVVDLEDCLAAGLQHAPALLDQPLRVGRVLNDAMGEHEIERIVFKRQGFAVGDAKVSGQPLLFEIGARQVDGRGREIDADDAGASLREASQVHAGAAAHLEHPASAIAVEVHQAQQVVQLLEMVLVEVVEESARADRMRRDLEVVDVLVPVFADAIDRRDVLCRGHRRPLYYRGWLRR